MVSRSMSMLIFFFSLSGNPAGRLDLHTCIIDSLLINKISLLD